MCFLSLLLLSTVAGFSQQSRLNQRAADRKAREQWFLRGRTTTGPSAAALRQRAFARKMQARALRAKSRISTATAGFSLADGWKPVGPLPLSSDASGIGQQDYGWVAGRATSVVVDPNDLSGNTVYVGGAFGGVWKSTNALSPSPANVSWLPLTDNQPTLAIGAIAVQPTSLPGISGTVVLAGTGEANSSTDSYYGLGILRSADAGLSWMLVSNAGSHDFKGLGFSKIVFSRDNPNLVVAATAGASVGSIDGLSTAPNLGVYVSNDAGITWALATMKDAGVTLPPASVTSLVYNEVSRTFFAAVRLHGFYSSGDGITWTRLLDQPNADALTQTACPVNPASTSCPIYRGELAAVPGRNEIYAWFVDGSDNDGGIWKSIDSGLSWTPLNDFGITACGDALDGCGTEDGSYNLTLAAVPSGNNVGQTDIYAGAINLFKCTTTAAEPDCSGVATHTFLNLTHVYGCVPNLGAPAHVHPAQHAIAFMQVANNTQAAMFFANDGGIYRALDGYSGLNSGDCGGTNSFESLNQTLGSMTQFVSFDHDPNNANTILGGAQGNGSPATAESLVDSQWREVNSGDGGYTALNPAKPDEWFTANTGVSIHKCEFGIACRAQDFTDGLVVSESTLDGDVGPFYTPFILDPGDPTQMIVGTCRVWRGATDGSGFSPLSVNFDTGSAVGCAGSEANQVRSLAALSGGSGPEMIYAGTDSFGPLASGLIGGHIWATDPVNGPGAWLDRTGTINPQHFPISAVAIDPFDPATYPGASTEGQAAYVAVMGFGSPHIWKTVNGGDTWMNFTGFSSTAFPDVPANAIAIDSSSSGNPPVYSGKIYVGTDQGVWVSGTNDIDSPSWSELGPPLSATSGYLPNVPVTALKIFNNGVTKLLRASTYGRGIWDFLLTSTPDFQISVPVPIQNSFGGGASFIGSLTSINGYASPVTLTCVSVPLPCTIVPSQVTPGSGFNLTAPGFTSDYTFTLHAVGGDPNTITHDLLLTVHSVDYSLGTPVPSAVTIHRGDPSVAIALPVTATGSFSAPVSLNCVSPPRGVSCSFTPSSQVFPTAITPVAVTLVVNTTAATAIGSSNLIVEGTATGAPPRSQSVALNILSKADYALTVSNPALTAATGVSATFTGVLTALDGYSGSVNISCGTGAPSSCSTSPSTLSPIAAGSPFTVSVASASTQIYNFDIIGQSADIQSLVRSSGVVFTTTGGSPFDFSLIDSGGPQTVRAGQTAVFTMSVQPRTVGATFPATVSFPPCTTTAPLSICTSPAQVAAGSSNTAVTLSITTTAPILASVDKSRVVWAMCLPGFAVVLGGRPKRRKRCLVIIATLLSIAMLIACGGGLTGGGGGAGQPGTLPGSYSVTVNATCNGITHPLQLNLTVD